MLARSSPGRALVALATCRALACDAEVAWPDAGPHAQWCLDHDRGPRAAAAARRFAHGPVDLVDTLSLDDAALLTR